MGELDHGAKLALRVDALSVIRLALPGASQVAPLPQQVVSAGDAAYTAVVDGRERGATIDHVRSAAGLIDRLRTIIPKEILVEMGRAEGQARAVAHARHGLRVALQLRLGAVPDEFSVRIDQVADLGPLEVALDAVPPPGSPDEVVDRVRRLLGPGA